MVAISKPPVKLTAPVGFPYGPFWRFEKDRNTCFQIQTSGVLRGRAPRNSLQSDKPAVKAYQVPSKVNGHIWFYTKHPPDRNCPPSIPMWRNTENRVKGEVRSFSSGGVDFAEIDVFVVYNVFDRRKSKDRRPPSQPDRRKAIP